jgi:hypothetical protein
MRPKRSSVWCVCPQCGVAFKRAPSLFEPSGNAYCSRACFAAIRRHAPVERRLHRLGWPVEERFWAQVMCQITTQCWLWTGSQITGGHAAINIEGRKVLAHRFSYELAHGPIPDGLLVCHNCPGGDNPRCVNPAHLWIGTHAENIRDWKVKGRSPHSPYHSSIKMKE